VEGISCTSWGGDFLLFHADASFIPPTRHYSDPRTAEGRRAVLSKVSRESIFEETGLADAQRSTLFQVGSEKSRHLRRAAPITPREVAS
jgi:sugar (pentulose or hexulose) kinase